MRYAIFITSILQIFFLRLTLHSARDTGSLWVPIAFSLLAASNFIFAYRKTGPDKTLIGINTLIVLLFLPVALKMPSNNFIATIIALPIITAPEWLGVIYFSKRAIATNKHILENSQPESPQPQSKDQAWTSPLELNQPLPRKYSTNSRFIRACASNAFLSLMFIFFINLTYSSISKLQNFKATGVHVDGEITNLHSQYHGGRGAHTDYFIDYKYNTPVWHGTAQVFPSDYNNAKIGQSIPVIVQKDDSKQSTLLMAVSPDMSESDPSGLPGFWSYFLNGSMLSIFLCFLALIIKRFFKQTRLIAFGKATFPTCIKYVQSQTRNRQFVGIMYSFKDNMGQIVNGKSNIAIEKFNPKSATILYNPNDSKQNALYPLDFTKCVKPNVFDKL